MFHYETQRQQLTLFKVVKIPCAESPLCHNSNRQNTLEPQKVSVNLYDLLLFLAYCLLIQLPKYSRALYQNGFDLIRSSDKFVKSPHMR